MRSRYEVLIKEEMRKEKKASVICICILASSLF